MRPKCTPSHLHTCLILSELWRIIRGIIVSRPLLIGALCAQKRIHTLDSRRKAGRCVRNAFLSAIREHISISAPVARTRRDPPGPGALPRLGVEQHVRALRVVAARRQPLQGLPEPRRALDVARPRHPPEEHQLPHAAGKEEGRVPTQTLTYLPPFKMADTPLLGDPALLHGRVLFCIRASTGRVPPRRRHHGHEGARGDALAAGGLRVAEQDAPPRALGRAARLLRGLLPLSKDPRLAPLPLPSPLGIILLMLIYGQNWWSGADCLI